MKVHRLFPHTFLSLFLITLLTGCPAFAETIRLGWQVPWATQGQLVQALKHSNIPELLDLDIEYVGFAYGGPLNKAALGGGVDVLLTADHPAAVLLSKQRGFKIVARMMYNRVCLYTPTGSAITDLDQLDSARLAGPIGAAAERVALAEVRNAGVDLSSVSLVQLDMAQQNTLIVGGSDWQGIDAMFGFDPLPAIWHANGQIEILKCGPVVSIVAASEEMTTERGDGLEDFLTAFHLSWETFRQNPEVLGKLFLEEARLEASLEALDQAASIEPNAKAEDMASLRLTFTEGDLATLNVATRFLQDRGSIPADFAITDHLDTGFIEAVLSARNAEALIDDVVLD